MNCDLILPGLFLGSLADAQHADLPRSGITHVLSLTCIPPRFPSLSSSALHHHDSTPAQCTVDINQDPPVSLRCKLVPVFDSNQQSLMPFFQETFDFIDEARNNNESVLVHCEAGISRSPTVTIAYLMYRLSISLHEAYSMVKRCRPRISPNLNFMGQLVELERKLRAPVILSWNTIYVEPLQTPSIEYKPFVLPVNQEIHTQKKQDTIATKSISSVSIDSKVIVEQPQPIAETDSFCGNKIDESRRDNVIVKPNHENQTANQSNQSKKVENRLPFVNEKLVSRKRELSLPLTTIVEPQLTSSPQSPIIRRFATKKASMLTRLSILLSPPALALPSPVSTVDLPLSPPNSPKLTQPSTPTIDSKLRSIRPQPIIDCAPPSPPISPPIKPIRPSSLLVTPWPSLCPSVGIIQPPSNLATKNSGIAGSSVTMTPQVDATACNNKAVKQFDLNLQLLLLKRRKLPIESDSSSSSMNSPFTLCRPKKMKNVALVVN